MKVGVLGSGLMGKEAARDLVLSEGVHEVGLADIRLEQAEAICKQFNSGKIKAYQVDANDEKQLAQYIGSFDVIINALFYTFNKKVAKTGIDLGVSVIDLGGHIGHVTDDILKLADEARDNGVTIIPDLGVAPGMINILSGYGASKLDQLTAIKLYVGGIPLRPEAPLGYNHVFSMEGLFDHYTDPSLVIRHGEEIMVPSLSGIEEIYFDQFGPLEAFHTSGGTSTLSGSFPELETLTYKTIRYPGHAEKFQLLVDLGLTKRDTTIQVDGVEVSPRNMLLAVLDPIVELGDKEDVVLLRVLVSGMKNNQKITYEYELVTLKDSATRVTAMARATANTISIVAQMIGGGQITKKGVYPPEQIVPGDLYIKELVKRGVLIKEKMKRDTSTIVH